MTTGLSSRVGALNPAWNEKDIDIDVSCNNTSILWYIVYQNIWLLPQMHFKMHQNLNCP